MLYMEVHGIMGVFYLTPLVQTDNHGLGLGLGSSVETNLKYCDSSHTTSSSLLQQL